MMTTTMVDKEIHYHHYHHYRNYHQLKVFQCYLPPRSHLHRH